MAERSCALPVPPRFAAHFAAHFSEKTFWTVLLHDCIQQRREQALMRMRDCDPQDLDVSSAWLLQGLAGSLEKQQ